MAEMLDFASDDYFMGEALRQARKAEAQEEVPIGAVIVYQSEIIARAWNQVETLKDATAHAEMLAINAMDNNAVCFEMAMALLRPERPASLIFYTTGEPLSLGAAPPEFEAAG